MHLFDFLREKIQTKIQYEDATNLCMAIYSSNDILPPEIIEEDGSMDRIAECFATLSRQGLIANYSTYKSVIYGANYHAIEDKGHWIEVQASILKLQATLEIERARVLLYGLGGIVKR